MKSVSEDIFNALETRTSKRWHSRIRQETLLAFDELLREFAIDDRCYFDSRIIDVISNEDTCFVNDRTRSVECSETISIVSWHNCDTLIFWDSETLNWLRSSIIISTCFASLIFILKSVSMYCISTRQKRFVSSKTRNSWSKWRSKTYADRRVSQCLSRIDDLVDWIRVRREIAASSLVRASRKASSRIECRFMYSESFRRVLSCVFSCVLIFWVCCIALQNAYA